MSTTPAIREAAGRLRAIQAWAKDHFPTYQDVVPYREEVLARYQPIFALDRIPSLTEEEFKSFLLFSNNRHWTLHRQGNKLCADMDLLREALSLLVDESRPLEERLDTLIPKTGDPMVPYLGRGVVTAILLIIAPDKYGVWNSTSDAGLKKLGVFPNFETGASFSERYLALNAVLQDLAREVGADLWTMDFLYYALDSYDDSKAATEGGDEEQPTELEESLDVHFGLEQHLHDFMRDNWDSILGSEWALLEQDGDVIGYKYQTDQVGEIDLLAKHKSEPRWLVIELKRNQTSDATVGQVLRYMGWVEEHLASDGEIVEGLIVAHSGDEKIRYALRHTSGVSLKLYEIDFRLKEPGA